MNKSKKGVLFGLIIVLAILAFVFGITVRLLKVYGSIVSGCFYYLFLLIIITYTVIKVEKESFESIGFDFKNLPKKMVLGIGIFVALSLFNLYFYFTQESFYLPHLELSQVIIRTMYYIFIVGFTEELIFRGYLLNRLKELINSDLYAVVISSVIFALWHFPVSYYWGQVVFAFFLGLVLSTFKVKVKGNIIVSLALAHGLYNSMLLWIGYFIK